MTLSLPTVQLLPIRIGRLRAPLSVRHFILVSNKKLTVNMGVAANENLCYENITSLLQAADTLLYKAKFRGSEQICLGQH
ncbi:MAG TPA: hypothetical protein DD453_03480 [Alteromonas macleodii]|nr:hypothetical protein [Alteromonas macleodii]HCS80517.1 hypothetical protein [Alteromonas macleodii]HCY29578.1 hypothetical protein [Alteromonas macleodii]